MGTFYLEGTLVQLKLNFTGLVQLKNCTARPLQIEHLVDIQSSNRQYRN